MTSPTPSSFKFDPFSLGDWLILLVLFLCLGCLSGLVVGIWRWALGF